MAGLDASRGAILPSPGSVQSLSEIRQLINSFRKITISSMVIFQNMTNCPWWHSHSQTSQSSENSSWHISLFAENKLTVYHIHKMQHITYQWLCDFYRPWVIIWIQAFLTTSLVLFTQRWSCGQVSAWAGVRPQRLCDAHPARVLRVAGWINSCHVCVCVLSCTG